MCVMVKLTSSNKTNYCKSVSTRPGEYILMDVWNLTKDKVLLDPDMNVEDTKQQEVPGHVIDNHALLCGEELVDKCYEKE